MKQKKIYDLTALITPDTVVFPGDPCFKTENIQSIEKGDKYNLCHLQLGNHTGTHIDFPAHLIKNGKTSSDYPVDALIGSGLIIELPESETSITDAFVKKQPILKGDFIFFKTANSKIPENEFYRNFVHIEPAAAKELVIMGVKIVGIDYLSVDSYEAENLPVHLELLANGVLIVEGLNLLASPIGRCKIYILPTNIHNMDGLPARVLAEQ